MNHLTLYQQVLAAVGCAGPCIALTIGIKNFRYIWAVEFGLKPYWSINSKSFNKTIKDWETNLSDPRSYDEVYRDYLKGLTA